MREAYAGHGIEFRYPAEWEISEQRDERQVSITVASPHTSFWTVTLLDDQPDPEDTVAAVLAAFREEYDELDVYASKARLGGHPTVARDVDFVCLELLNVARIRAIRTAEFTVLVLYQGNDAEFAEMEPLLEQITRSLTFAAPGASLADEPDEPDSTS